MAIAGCKSNKTAPLVPAEETIENPRPASDANLDSLKRVLDEQRKNKSK